MPVVGPERPTLAPYVDNANARCWDDHDASLYLAAIESTLTDFGSTYRVESDGDAAWNTVGVVLDAERRLIYNKPA